MASGLIAAPKPTSTAPWKRVAAVQAWAAVSQATAAAQLVALLLAVGRGRDSDTYVILFSASQVAVSVLVIGGLQPLTISRPHYSGWHRWRLVGSIANALLLAATAGFLVLAHYPVGTVLPTAAILSLSGIWAMTAAVRGVHYAALGRPGVLASVTTGANLFATAVVLLAPTHRVPAMCVGLWIGNVVTCAVIGRPPMPTPPDGAELLAEPLPRRDLAGLLASSSVGAVGPFALQAVTATYPAGQATVLGFASRVAAGIVSIGVTAFTNATTDWTRRSLRPLRLATQLGVTGLGGSMVGLAALTLAGVSGLLTAVLAALGFVCGAAAQACAGRSLAMKGRLVAFRRMAVLSIFLYALGVALLTVGAHTATLYFVVLAGITVASGIVFTLGNRWYREAAILSTLCLAAAVLLLVHVVAA